MRANVGGIDRIVRIVVGLALIGAALFHVIGLWGLIGIVPVLTGLFRVCPAYKLIGANTCRHQS
ncbi:MAG: DUF2892 domain-containing protein [Proteobacteria bacterium]|nr:DUF2892 domain-containing protein [Pseudomonadota bacterium]